jgi:hypothetical protein
MKQEFPFKVVLSGKTVAQASTLAEARAEAKRVGGIAMAGRGYAKRNPAKRKPAKRNPSEKQHLELAELARGDVADLEKKAKLWAKQGDLRNAFETMVRAYGVASKAFANAEYADDFYTMENMLELRERIFREVRKYAIAAFK